MLRKDLKTGMKIIFTNGDIGHVLLGTINGDIVAGQIAFPLDKFPENLKDWDELIEVKKVVQPNSNNSHLKNNDLGTVIWERKEEKPILELDGVEYSESTLRSLIKKATS